jgi:hypothetical protein
MNTGWAGFGPRILQDKSARGGAERVIIVGLPYEGFYSSIRIHRTNDITVRTKLGDVQYQAADIRRKDLESQWENDMSKLTDTLWDAWKFA